MSVSFGQRGGSRPPPNPAQIQKLLDENGHLIQTIQEYQTKGKAPEVAQYTQALHRNLLYLANVADSAQNVQALLPMLQSMVPPGPGGHGQSPNADQQHISNFNHQQQAGYRQPMTAQRPGVPAHPYSQRGYQQSQYPGQYPPQAYPQGQYPPNQPPGYPPGATQGTYGQPPSTTPHNNYQPNYGTPPPGGATPQPGAGPYPPPNQPGYGTPPNGAPYPNSTGPQNYPPQGYPPQQGYPPPPPPSSTSNTNNTAAFSNQSSNTPQNYGTNNAQSPPFSAPPTNPNTSVTSTSPNAPQPYQPPYTQAQAPNSNSVYTPGQGYPPGAPPTGYGYAPQPGYPPQPQYAAQPQGYQYPRPSGQPQGQYGYNYAPQPTPQ